MQEAVPGAGTLDGVVRLQAIDCELAAYRCGRIESWPSMTGPNIPNLEEWQQATAAYRQRARTDRSEGILRFVAGVHAFSALLLVVFGIGVLPAPVAWVVFAIAALPAWSGFGGFWLRDIALWVRVAASVAVLLSGLVTGPGLPFLLNLGALGALGVAARRARKSESTV